MQAKDIMTTNVVSIGPAVGIRHAVAVMMQNNVSGLPVVDDEGRVCGMLTEGDLLLRREIRFAPAPPVHPKSYPRSILSDIFPAMAGVSPMSCLKM